MNRLKRLGLTLLVAGVLSGCAQTPGAPEPKSAKTAPPPSPAEPPAPSVRPPAPEAPAPPSPPPSPRPEGPVVPPRNPDLLAHWKLDEKSGTSAADASGNHHSAVLQQGGTWVEGRIGGGISFDGKGGHLEVPSSPDLDRVNLESYSIAAWFKPVDLPSGTEAQNNANYGILIKTGWHEGLRFTNEGRFVMEHWLAGEPPVWTGAGTWETSYAAGQWYHVAGVVDVKARLVRVYVNGELGNTSEEWEAGKKPRDYETTTWKIGIGAPGSEEWSWPAKAAIDDVRIYKRALSDQEVEKLWKEASR